MPAKICTCFLLWLTIIAILPGNCAAQRLPVFAKGASIVSLVCENAISNLDTLLAVTDSGTGQTDTWSVYVPPAHGALAGFAATAISNGGLIIPSGLSYTPTSGYQGNDSFSIKISNSAGYAITRVHVTVSPYVMPSVTIRSDAADSTCWGMSMTILPSPVNGGANPQYEWIMNGVDMGPGSEYYFIPDNGDTIQCLLRSNFQCLAVDSAWSNKLGITVLAYTTPTVTVTSSFGPRTLAGVVDTLTGVVTGAGLMPSYQWEINGSLVAGANQETLITTVSGTDTITCLVTSNDFCGASSLSRITVSPTEQVSGFMLYPNPTNGIINVKASGIINSSVSWDVCDMLGQKVCSGLLPVANGVLNQQIVLNGSIANADYFLRLRAENFYKLVKISLVR